MIKDVLTASELLETFFQSLTDLVRSIIALIIKTIPHQSISASKTRMDRNETHEVIASLVSSSSRRGVISRRVGRAVIPLVEYKSSYHCQNHKSCKVSC